MKTDRMTRAPWLLGLAILWIAAYFLARILLKGAVGGPWLRSGIALFPIPFFVLFLVSFIGSIRRMDELERRIHLEALAVAYPLAMVLIMVLGLLERAIQLPFEDWSFAHVWAYLPLFYFVGLALARRRYQ
jgi:hypothetical protein